MPISQEQLLKHLRDTAKERTMINVCDRPLLLETLAADEIERLQMKIDQFGIGQQVIVNF